MEVEIKKINVHDRFRKKIGDLTKLKDSIEAIGLLHPVVITPAFDLIAGQRRLEACTLLEWDKIPVTIIEADNIIKGEHDENTCRKDFTMSEKVAIAKVLEPEAKEQAKERQGKRTDLQHSGNFPEGGKGDSRDKIASGLGISGKTLEKAEVVITAAEEEPEKFKDIADKMDETGNVDRAFKAVKKAKKAEEKAKIINAIPAFKENGAVNEALTGWYKIGNQFLYCGSNLDDDFRSFLPVCALAFADPPYNADVANWDNNFTWEQDYLQDIARVVAVTPGGWNAKQFYEQTKMNYIWEMACWIKNGMTHGRCGYANFIKTSIFSKGKVKIPQDFWNITIKTNKTEDTEHKGRKPYEFMIHIIDTFTAENENIIDPFAGSGTTLLVAEKMGRVSYNAEKEIIFCSEIIERAKEQGIDYERI